MNQILIKRLFVLLLLMALSSVVLSEVANVVTVLEVDDMIAGGHLSYLERELKRAVKEGSIACVILLNTPGGLVNTTVKINELILNTPMPVIVYVYPSGGMAASAGSFILLASDIAAMAPVTTIGSAQPISITASGLSDAGDKTRKFLSRHAKSLAEDKNRPLDVANDFVEHNLALTANEALEKGVIDFIADDIADLLQQIDGMKIEKKEQVFELSTSNCVIVQRSMVSRESVQQWLSNPQTAMMFLMLGLLGLYVGFNTPGTFVPEVLGAIVLVLGIYGLGLFETNIIGIILLVLGVSLLIAEFFTPGFGILGIGGIISLVLGAILLPVEPLMGVSWYSGFIRTMIGFGVGIGAVLLFVVYGVIKSIKKPVTDTMNLSLPDKGIVIQRISPQGFIKAKGEIWMAKSADGKTIELEQEVRVIGKEDTFLIVKEMPSP